MGPSGGVSVPNRLRSALLNGRSQAKPLPSTNQVRRPWRRPSVTSGRPVAMVSTSSRVATAPAYRRGRIWAQAEVRYGSRVVRNHSLMTMTGRSPASTR